MPGRVSTRAATASSRTSRKSPVPPAGSSSRAAVAVPDEGPATTLRTKLCTVFADAQRSTAGHRKLAVTLRKIQEACCHGPTAAAARNGLEGFGEDDFNVEVARCALRLVGVKKSETVGDRLVRFLGLFLRHACDKDAALLPPEAAVGRGGALPETPSTRLTSHVLAVVLPLLASKEKTVRYRATQIVAHIVSSLESIEDGQYHLVRSGLLKRVRDREAMVRVQAVLGLGRLAGNEADGGRKDDGDSVDDDDADATGLLGKLLDVLQNDPSADVRRSLLLNLPFTPATLPYLLERARDVDPATRRALYSRLLPALGDFRHLSLSMREKLLRWGLRDRDENVRKATARIFRERWIEDCAGTRDADGNVAAERPPPSIEALLELLERIDVVNSGTEGGIALEALREFWDGRPDYRDAVLFDDAFWDGLTAESVFMARTFNDFCRQGDGKYEALVEEKIPEVTKLAFMIERYTTDLVAKLRTAQSEEETVEQEFVVEQLLHIAETLDYTDEIGRRKMFALLREALATPELPDEITRLVVGVLREVCGSDSAGEREFCGVVLEAVAEVHDTIAEEEEEGAGGGGGDTASQDASESFHSAMSEISETRPTGPKGGRTLLKETAELDEEKAIQEIVINMKCLHIARCMLQNVGEYLQDNVHLVTMLNNLVVPAVRSHEAPIRERGLLCLGLCCLLDKTLAEENLTLFLHCFTKGHDALQTTALEILCDILTTHPSLLSSPDPTLRKSIFKVFSKGTKATQAPEVQAASVTALCKLMLTGVVADEDLLRQLVVTFFEPATGENAAVRQALSYFLPVYCHSRRENMERMGRVVPALIHALIGMTDELEEEEEMVGMAAVAGMLVDWTDARKLVAVQDTATAAAAGEAADGDIHLDLAEALLEKALAHSCSKEERKALLLPLPKLYISSSSSSSASASSAEKLAAVHALATEATALKLAPDAATRNALLRLQTALAKALGEATAAEAGSARTGKRGRTNGSQTPTPTPTPPPGGQGEVLMTDGDEGDEDGDEDDDARTVVPEDREGEGQGQGQGEEDEDVKMEED